MTACRAVACLIPRKLPLGAALIHTSTPSALNAGKRGRGCGAGFCKLSFPLLSSLTLSPRLHLKQQAKAKPSSAVQLIAVLSLRCSRTPQLRGILEGEKSSTNSCVLTKFTCFLLLALESGRIKAFKYGIACMAMSSFTSCTFAPLQVLARHNHVSARREGEVALSADTLAHAKPPRWGLASVTRKACTRVCRATHVFHPAVGQCVIDSDHRLLHRNDRRRRRLLFEPCAGGPRWCQTPALCLGAMPVLSMPQPL